MFVTAGHLNPMRVSFWMLPIAILFSFPVATIADDPVNYTRQVKPILAARCYSCHGGLQQQSGLRLDTGSLIRRGGDGGAVVMPGDPDGSMLLQRVSATDASERMPPEGEPLTAIEVQILADWITQGADSPEGEQPQPDPRDHWAFRPPQRPDLPVVSGAPGNSIDAFLGREQRQHDLVPRPVADRAVLLRRVSLDLIGLPPTSEELRAFLADDAPSAYATVVDRLLSDPRHGERWARHWMDIWRYSDWYGRRDVNDVRNSASQIWRWRDWIVQSLNDNKGYDRMLQEMLAADEICPEDYEAGVATGYLIRNYFSLNFNDWMRNTVEHTGKAFLGLTFNCAHCHDHKYDPITNDDYFRMRAFFEPIYIRQDRVPGEPDPGLFQDYTYAGSRAVQRLGSVRIYDKSPDAPTWQYAGGDERNRVTERGSIPPGVPTFLAEGFTEIEPVALPPRAWYPGFRPEVQQAVLHDAREVLARAEADLAEATKSTGEVPAELRERLTRAETDYEQARAEASRIGEPGALAGQQSLLLDAATGRRIVQNGLSSLETLADGTLVEFRLLILNDAHVNFQFARDILKGLTAGYVAFEQGVINSYQPGSFTVFEAGRYDFQAGQSGFQVQLVVQPSLDQCLLSVRSLSDDALLVDHLPVALNGWNPVGDETKAITFDARTGSRAVIDDVVLFAPAAEGAPRRRLIAFDFETPSYSDGQDIIGTDGWKASSFCVAPATSIVSGTAANLELRQAEQELELARRAVRAHNLPVEAAEASLNAARASLVSVEARIAADRARFGERSVTEASALSQTASRLEHQAALTNARSDVLSCEVALSEAEARPDDDADRPRQIDTARQALTTARSALAKAQTDTEGVASESYSFLSHQYPQTSTGRRSALARWITDRNNPLTARVAVNHIWARHFHSPLVTSVYDFGVNGDRPTHPKLLDWLAVEFMESGWDMKHLHRLIVTSRAYQRVSSVGDTARNAAIDPENRLLWKMNIGRMESEVLRDSLLYCAGQLDPTLGGVELENDQALSTSRRSLYYSVHPENGGKSALGKLFDAPNPLDCYRRTSSIIPQQALVLTNSELVHRLSADLVEAWQLEASTGDPADPGDEKFIRDMFERILSRPPGDAEHRLCLAALARQRELDSSGTAEQVRRARESLVRVLFNHNDFVTIR